jgi:hypothetical protein
MIRNNSTPLESLFFLLGVSSNTSLLDPILITDSIPVIDCDTIPIDREISDHDGTYVRIDCAWLL